MNRGVILVVLLGLSLSVGLWPLARPYFPKTFGGIKNALPTLPSKNASEEMSLTSPDLQSAGILPTQYTCDGRGISPELTIAHVPAGTTSLAVTMIDIDVPSLPGSTFYHWGLWGIPPTTSTIPSNSIPQSAIRGTTSAKSTTYVPPCPPSGEHRYVFTVHALRGTTPMASGGTVQQFISSTTSQVISSASIVTRYKRK